MSGWSDHTGLGVGLARENVDTDQLIPARFMSAPRSQGYGKFLLHDLRGPGFQLDDPAAQGASVLVAGRNFGGGSSREAAVYALIDAGFRVVIAPSFGDIFTANAVNNGLLPARAETGALLALMPREISIDLPAQTIRAGNTTFSFEIDPVAKTRLINGWDDIDVTASYRHEIAAFAAKARTREPWVWRTANRGDAPKPGRN